MLAKAILATAMAVASVCSQATAETLRLKGSPAGKDAEIFSRDDSKAKNYGDSPRFQAGTWTWNADNLGEGTYRGLLAFDLSSIPAGAYVHEARLHLFCDTTGFSKGHSSLSNSNAATLVRITQAWAESTVTWDNKPAFDTAGRANLAQSKGAKDNYEVDVTALVARMAAKPDSNFGMMLFNRSESPYNALVFASGDHADTTLRPVLEVTWFKTKLETLELRPDSSGKDAVIWSSSDATQKNYGDSPRFNTETWTWNNDNLGEGTTRSLIEFDLKGLPAGAKVQVAELHLSCDTANFNHGHSSLSQSNAAWLSRVTEPWSEHAVTWATQPKVRSTGRVALAKSATATQDYVVNVTGPIAEMAAKPAENYGFQLASQVEQPYYGLYFSSSDHPDTAQRPRLVVRYSVEDVDPVSVDWTPVQSAAPAHRLAGRTLSFVKPVSGVVTDLRGAVLARFSSDRLDLSGLRSGLYLVLLPGATLRLALP